mgnify:CR=1 FL=1
MIFSCFSYACNYNNYACYNIWTHIIYKWIKPRNCNIKPHYHKCTEYYAAKKFKNKNESRIRFLERMIKTAEVVSDESAADEVGMNNKVEVWFEEDDETETYKIVTTMRQDSLKGLISGESPLGKALLGHKVGDRIFVEIGGGDGYYVVIRSIDKSAGDDDELRSF